MAGYKITRWDKFVCGVAPKFGTRRIQAKVALRSYEAAGKGRRTSGWKRTSADANAAATGALVPLREYARDLKRNNPWAKRGLGVIATNTIGFGIEAKAAPGPHEDEATAIWLKWSRKTSLDYDGRLSFSGIQKLVMASIAESGEVLVVRQAAVPSDGLPVPVRLRVLETDFIDTNKFSDGRNGNPVVQGIETDGRGRRVAYWLFDSHPGASSLAGFSSGASSKRVSAENIIHIYRVDRPGQMRGIPWLTTAIARLQDLDEYEDAKLMQQKVAALFAVFITDPDGQGSKLGGDDPAGSEEVEELEPGTLQYLKPGQEVKAMQPPNAADHGEITTSTQRAIAAGLDVTYEDLTGDYSKVNFSSARMGRMAHYASVDDWRWNMVIPQLCVGVWGWVMEMAAGLNNWSEIPESMWAAPAIPMISPEKEGLAYNRLVRGGFMTLSQAIRERGENPTAQILEIARMNALLDEHGIVLDSDPRHTSAAGLAQDATEASTDPAAATTDD